MRKRNILALISAAALAVTLSACGGTSAAKLPALEAPEAGQASSGVESGVETVARVKPDGSNYGDTLGGLWLYMEEGGAVAFDKEKVTISEDETIAIADDVTSFIQMSYKEIGATDGYRCFFTYLNSTIQVELYSFDPDNLDEKGRSCLDSVKEKGFFVVLDNEVQAVLHPNGKYLMVYTDTNAEKNEDNASQKEWAIELFQSFQA